MKHYVGTSGYSYKEWKGSFYPEKTKSEEMLGYYGSQLNAVEINNTFYRMPKKAVLANWRDQVDKDFRFVIKASRRITHIKRLQDCVDEIDFLCGNVETLRENLGCLLFQLPGNFKKDIDRLAGFCDLIPLGLPCAFEFRHASWLDQEVYDCLHRADYALVAVDDEEAAEVISTATWGYARLRRADYTDQQLAQWAQRLGSQGWRQAFVFFKHEDGAGGPELAKQFVRLAEIGVSS